MAASDVPRHYKLSLREQDSGEWTVEVIRAHDDTALDAFRRYDLGTAIDKAIAAMYVDRANHLGREREANRGR